jgi:hypothetical protein
MKSKKNRKNNFNLQNNKYVMYALLVVAIINLLMFLQKNYLGSILLFFIVGLITTLYTKNMNIILFSTIIITNLTVFVIKMFGYKEGLGSLTNKNDKPIKCKGGDGKKTNLKMVNQPLFAIAKSKDDDDDDDEGFIGFRGGAESIYSLTGKAFKEGYAGKKKEGNTGMKKEKKEEEEPRKPLPKPLPKPPLKKPPIKETMINKKPKPMEDDEDDEDDDEGFKSIKEDIAESDSLTKSLRKNNISKETEKEIKKMLKGTDIKNLNTNELIEQQKGLMDAMKNMDPLIKSVNEMIKNLKDSPISGFMGLGK